MFGSCEIGRGRGPEAGGGTHVLTVPFDVLIVTEHGQMNLTLVVEAVGGSQRTGRSVGVE